MVVPMTYEDAVAAYNATSGFDGSFPDDAMEPLVILADEHLRRTSWIPCDHIMPKLGHRRPTFISERVLVWDGQIVRIDQFDFKSQHWLSERDVPTHWMPLPTFPGSEALE